MLTGALSVTHTFASSTHNTPSSKTLSVACFYKYLLTHTHCTQSLRLSLYHTPSLIPTHYKPVPTHTLSPSFNRIHLYILSISHSLSHIHTNMHMQKHTHTPTQLANTCIPTHTHIRTKGLDNGWLSWLIFLWNWCLHV